MPTLLVTGGNRGIGRELVRQYAAAGWSVHTTARQPVDLGPDVTVHVLDVTDFAAIAALADRLSGTPIDLLLANAGIYGGESELGGFDFAVWQAVLRVNVLGPAAFAQAFAPHLAASQGRTFAVISSGLGSIAENTSGGIY
ncbi:MAG: SDR family NAD(P)-dependent oxidoreductase, partial [Deltaproteobacteria bacterium]|nr:SDR family NAD(P)-dependent oxidoreductase [Deltaproteobacteria bacterium]